MHRKEEFIKNRKSIQVAPYALAEVIDALTNDPEHFADIVVTKEDGHLVVMFNRTHKSCKCLNDDLLGKAIPKEDKHDYLHDYPMRDYPIPTHGDPVLCDINVTSAGENNNTINVTTRQSCETLY
jgi:hypothetical protein